MTNYIDQKLVEIFFNYDEYTGILTNAYTRGVARKGDESGTLHVCGSGKSKKVYRRVMLEGKFFYTHRIIWVIMTGEQPNEIDHKDGDGLNNKWANLQEGDHLANGKNQKKPVNNTSGHTGVCYRNDSGRWRARIMVEDKMISLGTFSDKDGAIKARLEAEVEYGFSPQHNRRAL